jgi:hypothetical protein
MTVQVDLFARSRVLLIARAIEVSRMFRTLLIVFGIGLAGCISTPNTKALITPLGGVGVHSFAPPQTPDLLPPSDADGLARIAANQRACAADVTCAQHE